ncbi:gamma-glutamylcyclotransferase family protein [Vreelandella nanhaiensis]|uniref:Gamma-glutamylcyclotransferase n=1 Tax=Vreelandella nanhaiensis TaxID=1258546 RepID=A0A3S0XXM5_9GAMM|nr:gamma-glutamylcyclotransferase family protein [Halomonas nanhaiensis]RUR32570.1 gamma-glutamylcyclotransferase [Halomonas nanhaiensis]
MVWIKKLLQITGVIVLGLATWLWLTMLSPWFYSPLDEISSIEKRTHNVFVYGTLRYTAIRWVVMGGSGNPQAAALDGYQRNGLDLSPQPGSRVEGLKLEVSTEQLERLDRYERLGVRYERVKKRLIDGSSAWVYVRLPATSQLLTPFPAGEIALIP